MPVGSLPGREGESLPKSPSSASRGATNCQRTVAELLVTLSTSGSWGRGGGTARGVCDLPLVSVPAAQGTQSAGESPSHPMWSQRHSRRGPERLTFAGIGPDLVCGYIHRPFCFACGTTRTMDTATQRDGRSMQCTRRWMHGPTAPLVRATRGGTPQGARSTQHAAPSSLSLVAAAPGWEGARMRNQWSAQRLENPSSSCSGGDARPMLARSGDSAPGEHARRGETTIPCPSCSRPRPSIQADGDCH